MSDVHVIELRGVAKIYGRATALKATSLVVDRGEVIALLGPNGSGKTTILKIVAGALTPTFGRGTVLGTDIERRPYTLRIRIGLLAAETYLYDDLTAFENLRFTGTMAGVRLDSEAVSDALRRVDLLNRSGERVREYSSGMKRRLALARVLLTKPDILLLDEPYNSLDSEAALLIDGVIRDVSRDGGVIMLATHDAPRALSLASRVLALQRGATVYSGPAVDYRTAYAHNLD